MCVSFVRITDCADRDKSPGSVRGTKTFILPPEATELPMKLVPVCGWRMSNILLKLTFFKLPT